MDLQYDEYTYDEQVGGQHIQILKKAVTCPVCASPTKRICNGYKVCKYCKNIW